MAQPDDAFARLTGRPAHPVTEDASPRAAGGFALWEPPLSAAGDRRGGMAEAADVLTDAMCAGFRSLAFIASRRGTETLAATVREQVGLVDESLTGKVAAYRGGYLAEERRALESAPRSGRLLAVASTNALELGIDISGLDLVIVSGWPGTLASLWRQAGRAGRAGQRWMAVFIARDDPLDTYVVHHPEVIFDAPVDAGVINPGNPYVLAGHLCAAAAEVPLTRSDFAHFPDNAAEVVDDLVERKLLRARPLGWFWAKDEPATDQSDIRGSGGGQFRLVEASTGTPLGTVDETGAHRGAHPGAVYTHQGTDFLVEDLDLDEHIAPRRPRGGRLHNAGAFAHRDLHRRHRDSAHSALGCRRGQRHRRRHRPGRRLSDAGEARRDDPRRTRTRPARAHPSDLSRVVDDPEGAPRIRGGAGGRSARSRPCRRACLDRSLALFAGRDRWDIGGVSTALHADTGMATVFVYDGLAGGAGFAERGGEVIEEWLGATRDAIAACECVDGCPSCVQSPKCGNGNEPLDKDAALRLLRAVL